MTKVETVHFVEITNAQQNLRIALTARPTVEAVEYVEIRYATLLQRIVKTAHRTVVTVLIAEMEYASMVKRTVIHAMLIAEFARWDVVMVTAAMMKTVTTVVRIVVNALPVVEMDTVMQRKTVIHALLSVAPVLRDAGMDTVPWSKMNIVQTVVRIVVSAPMKNSACHQQTMDAKTVNAEIVYVLLMPIVVLHHGISIV